VDRDKVKKVPDARVQDALDELYDALDEIHNEINKLKKSPPSSKTVWIDTEG
jgi:hypothetical protein